MLKILFLSQRVPYPPDRGDRIRSYHILRYLAERHQVSLAAVADERPHPDHVRALEALCDTVDVEVIVRRRRALAVAGHLATSVPLTVPVFWSAALKAKIDQRLSAERFDLVFIYCSAMAPYVLSRPTPPKIIDFVDADSQKWLDYASRARSPMKLVYWREGWLLRRFERRVADACVHAFIASERDARILRQFAPGCPLTTLPQGVTIPPPALTRPEAPTLVFTGVMDYWPNVDAMLYFAREIFPAVRQRVPDARLLIVGQRPSRAVTRLARTPGITVTGRVPDVLEYLRSAAVFVAPLRIARGVQNKVLEAMAAGVPVVCTSAALGDIGAVPNRHVMVADTPSRFALATSALLRNRQRRERLGRAAAAFIRDNYQWDDQLARLDAVLGDLERRQQSHGFQPIH